MNTTTYLFGKLGNEYFQYPNDYTRSMFQDFYEKAKAKTQILIHRQDSLMYYGYIRKLDVDESQYIGMCVVLNGVMFEDIKYLFQTFEKVFIYLASASDFLTINDNGDIIQTAQKYLQLDEIEAVRDILEKRASNFSNRLVKLPPVDYSKASSEVKEFTFNDSNQSIVGSTYKYSYTYVYKDKEYNTPSLSNYKGVIRRLNTEKKELAEQYDKLLSEHKEVVRQKKQYTFIVFLCITIAISSFVVFNNISDKKEQINTLNTRVNALNTMALELKEEIKDKQKLLSTQDDRIQSLTNQLEEKKKIEERYTDLKHMISLPTPILISDIEIGNTDLYGKIETFFGFPIFSSSTMYLTPRIKYIGISSGKIALYIKIYDSNGVLCKGASSMSVKLGGPNYEQLIGFGNSQKGYWKSGNYNIEIWHDDMCLQQKEFKIL